LPDFYIGFYHVAKNLKEYFKILISYPVYSQIWLNFIMDDNQFSYITNMRIKNLGSICTAVVKLPVMLNCLFHPAASGPVANSLWTWSHVV